MDTLPSPAHIPLFAHLDAAGQQSLVAGMRREAVKAHDVVF